jgi:type VI secretion system protein ImpK
MKSEHPMAATPEQDRTVVVPTPGKKWSPSQDRGGPETKAAQPVLEQVAGAVGVGLNPLVRAANPLLDLVVPLRTMSSPPNIEVLRETLVQAVRRFEAEARNAGVNAEAIAAARYALCTLLDETIACTPWGAGSAWSTRSLLVAFHHEAWGGEKFFLILQRLSKDARANIASLELMYLCLALGLEGRYRVAENGRSQLETVRERLLLLIRKERPAPEPALSLHWQPAPAAVKSLRGLLPAWVALASCGALLLVLHLGYTFLLNRASDPVFASLGRLRIEAPPAPPEPPTPAAPSASQPSGLAGFLAPEVEQGLVSVREGADRTTVTIRGDGMFASGSADMSGNFLPLIHRIGDALKPLSSRVLVVGHTDDTRPKLSTRFPSNWELSRARAQSVSRLLAQRAGPEERYAAEGRGDTEPLVANDSPATRARNRRVDIVVLSPVSKP